jgi:hypothetical protein
MIYPGIAGVLVADRRRALEDAAIQRRLVRETRQATRGRSTVAAPRGRSATHALTTSADRNDAEAIDLRDASSRPRPPRRNTTPSAAARADTSTLGTDNNQSRSA